MSRFDSCMRRPIRRRIVDSFAEAKDGSKGSTPWRGGRLGSASLTRPSLVAWFVRILRRAISPEPNYSNQSVAGLASRRRTAHRIRKIFRRLDSICRRGGWLRVRLPGRSCRLDQGSSTPRTTHSRAKARSIRATASSSSSAWMTGEMTSRWPPPSSKPSSRASERNRCALSTSPTSSRTE